MADTEPLSFSAMLNALPKLRIPTAKEAMRDESPTISPSEFLTKFPRKTNKPQNYACFFGFCDHDFEPTELEPMSMHLFYMMTSSQDDLFEEVVSSLNLVELQRMGYFLTSDSDYFMVIATTEYGSKRLQSLLWKSDDVAESICSAILRSFLHVMTNKHASDVAVRALKIWDGEYKHEMFGYTLHYALDVACDPYGCIALTKIIAEVGESYYRDQLVEIVVDNAFRLSTDPVGNFLVQHVVILYDWFCDHCIRVQNIPLRFTGHCVGLSFDRHGSEVVKRLLEAKESVVVVVFDLIECEDEEMMRLAESGYGNSVVCKAVKVTHEMRMLDLYWRLVRNLTPFLEVLGTSPESSIEAILNSSD